MFLDHAKINVKAGNGGNGAISFHREKYISAGGPDGGDGGNGGDIIFIANNNMSTLSDFRYKKKYKAENGMDGSSSNKTGKSGEDLVISVPMGTMLIDEDTGAVIVDLVDNGQIAIVAGGGKGGKGNQHFATSTRQAPGFAKSGTEGNERNLTLELKLLAEVGLIGFPNVGKSSLLARVTSAKPKIANYHFTTIIPNLGIVSTENGKSFVMADIPGLIEGANENVGLGHEFLRHVERTRVLVHIVDVSGSEGRNPIEDYDIINKEISLYDKNMAQKPQIIVANKIDIIQDPKILDLFINEMKERGHEVFPISTVTGDGVKTLLYDINKKLEEMPIIEQKIERSNYRIYKVEKRDEADFNVYVENNVFYIEGPMMKRLLSSINIENHESLAYFQKVLKNNGVIEELKQKGINEGDSVCIGNIEFEYME